MSKELCEKIRTQHSDQASVPRQYAPPGPHSTLPQRKSKGRAIAHTLTGAEMVVRTSERVGKRGRIAVEVENAAEKNIFFLDSIRLSPEGSLRL